MGHYDSCRPGNCPRCGQSLGNCDCDARIRGNTVSDSVLASGVTVQSDSANARQVGGDHYRGALQHWDLVERYGVGYLEGCATKYIQRWRKKGGLQDLQKAEHYVQKLLELYDEGVRIPRGVVPINVLGDFCRDHGLTVVEMGAIVHLCSWNCRTHLEMALADVRDLILQARELEGAAGR